MLEIVLKMEKSSFFLGKKQNKKHFMLFKKNQKIKFSKIFFSSKK